MLFFNIYERNESDKIDEIQNFKEITSMIGAVPVTTVFLFLPFLCRLSTYSNFATPSANKSKCDFVAEIVVSSPTDAQHNATYSIQTRKIHPFFTLGVRKLRILRNFH
jgi:hypothetical protein